MEYPRFKLHIAAYDLIEHFTLTSDERYLLSQWRKDTNCLGFAVLIKSFQFLGYPPRQKENIPDAIISCISCQLKLDVKLFNEYRWKDSVWKAHLSSIREFTGFKSANENDFQKLVNWLIDEARRHPTRSKMYAAAIYRCRHLRLELPREKELQRLVNSAWQQYLSIVCREISERLGQKIRIKMDQCLDFDPDDKEHYGWMKANPRKIGMKTLLLEIKRLQFVNAFGIKAHVHLVDVPDDVLKLLRERAAPEGSYQMKRHQPEFRYALMAVLLHFRRMELTDNITEIFLNLIRRIEKKADKKLERNLIRSYVFIGPERRFTRHFSSMVSPAWRLKRKTFHRRLSPRFGMVSIM
jgi:hypothetical protein